MIPLFLAGDTSDYKLIRNWLFDIGDSMDLKLGLEFFTAHGLDTCHTIRNLGASFAHRQLFLDLKLHDIPATVAGSIRSVLRIQPTFVTVHASGGIEMMEAAKAAADEALALGLQRPKILGVTVLTSDKKGKAKERAFSLACDAEVAGLDGLVCSPLDVKHLRRIWPNMFLMVPGIRLDGGDTHDQHRTGTPRQAMEDGADALVIGRAITQASNIPQTVRDIITSISVVARAVAAGDEVRPSVGDNEAEISTIRTLNNFVKQGANKRERKLIRKIARKTDSPAVRNAAALAMADLRIKGAKKLLIKLLNRLDTTNHRGTLLCALDELDGSLPFALAVNLLLFENYEGREETFSIFGKGRYVAKENELARALYLLQILASSNDEYVAAVGSRAINLIGNYKKSKDKILKYK